MIKNDNARMGILSLMKTKSYCLWLIYMLIPLFLPADMAGISTATEGQVDRLIFKWHVVFVADYIRSPKVESVAYSPRSQSAIFSIEPASKPNIIRLRLDSLDVERESIGQVINYAQVTQGPIRHVLVSPDGIYSVFTGRTREVVILENDLPYLTLTVQDEITAIDINDQNIIALGDRLGNLIFIDVSKKLVLRNMHLFDGEVTSLVFYGEGYVLASGNRTQIVQVAIDTGSTVRVLETASSIEKLICSGVKQDRINKIIYIKSEDRIVSSHGWDDCRAFRLKVWDATSGKLLQKIGGLKSPFYRMIWVPKIQSLILIDQERYLWKMNLRDMRLSNPRFLPEIAEYFSSVADTEKLAANYGNVNSVVLIPDSSKLIIARGSYFKGGAGLSLVDVAEVKPKVLASLFVIGNVAQLFLPEHLFPK